jgi:hypothetical protein
MDSNTHSNRLGSLPAAVDELATEDLDRLTDAALAEDIVALRRWLDRLEGQWLRRVAAGVGWLRQRLRLGAGAARETVHTARALFRGPLTGTAQALASGVISPTHARVLAQTARHVPDLVTAEAEPVLLEAARRLDPPLLRQAVGYLLAVADPEGADQQAERRHARRGLWLSPTWDGMVAVDGLLEAEAGHTVLAALEPLARPVDADDTRKGGQRNADALFELARRALEGGGLPRAGGGPPPAAGLRGPGQSGWPSGGGGWGAGLGRATGGGGLPATRL